MTLITAIHLCEQKRERLHISIKESLIEIFTRTKSDLSTQKAGVWKSRNPESETGARNRTGTGTGT